MSRRRFKTKRHTAPKLRYDGQWLVYDSDHQANLPVLVKVTRGEAAKHARQLNLTGGAEVDSRRYRYTLALAREYYSMLARGSSGFGIIHKRAADLISEEEAFAHRRALNL